MTNHSTYLNLVNNLEDIIKIYRALLLIVRREKEILISANLDDLNENNKVKEETLLKAKKLERERLEIVKKLVAEDRIPNEKPTLLELSVFYEGDRGEKLQSLHAVLEILVKRLKDINSFNEKLINSALHNITGAMKSIKELLEENKTYQKEGGIQSSPATQSSGQLVSKQV